MLHSLEAHNILVTGPKSRALGFDSLGFRNLGLGLVNHTILQSCIYVCLGDVRVRINIMNV